MSERKVKYTSVDSIQITFGREEVLRLLEEEARKRWSIRKEFVLSSQDVYDELTDFNGKEIELCLVFKHSVEIKKEDSPQLDGHNI